MDDGNEGIRDSEGADGMDDADVDGVDDGCRVDLRWRGCYWLSITKRYHE